MLPYSVVSFLLFCMIFILGANVGSFLNVVIYRLPLGISVNHPKRSFCPKCKTQIPWFRNIPVLTWLIQSGKCASCKCKIPARYFFVELLTGIVFLAIVSKFYGGWENAREWMGPVFIYWIFASLLIAGTFIDIDHFILPHEITLSGIALGLLGSLAVPELMQVKNSWNALGISLASAALGFGVLWFVVEMGKLAFGRVKKAYSTPEKWSIQQPRIEQAPVFTIEGEELTWEDIYTRKSDRLILSGPHLRIDDQEHLDYHAEIFMDRVQLTSSTGKHHISLEQVQQIQGEASKLVIPREAMGFGDVILIAMIGSVLGWQSVFFTIVAASFLGCIVAVVPRVLGKAEWGSKIPFGPYLAAGAMIWLFYGAELVDWYLTRTGLRGMW